MRKNIITIFLITFLYILTFFFFDNSDFEKFSPSLKKADFEDIVEKALDYEIKKVDEKQNLRVLKHYEKYYPQKFDYPKFYKKGKITLFINNPLEYNSPSFSTKALPCLILKDKINSAKEYIDIAIYGFNNQDEIIQSLISASKRGVEIKSVFDSDEKGITTYKDNLKLNNYSKITYDNSKSIMHNKFFVIDDNFLLTGSMNISNTGCGGYNANSVLIIEDKDIIAAYKNEFEQMFDGKFKNKKKDFSYKKEENGRNLGVYFAPSGKVYEKIISKEIDNAKEKIKISVFVLSNFSIKDSLISALKRNVDVKIILDATSAYKQRKIIEELRQSGAKIKIENFGGKNHEKTIQIDNDVLILGSANLSYNAMTKNDENVIYIKDKDFAKFYSDYFEKLYASINDIYLSRYPKAESLESQNSCFDKIDNNFNGKVDKDDVGCKI